MRGLRLFLVQLLQIALPWLRLPSLAVLSLGLQV